MFSRSLLVALIITCIGITWAAAQASNLPNSLANTPNQEPSTEVKSDLVRVLVFVYLPNPWKGKSLAKDEQCHKDTEEAAKRATPGGQFPKPCKAKDEQCRKNAQESWRAFQAKFQRPKSCEGPEEQLTLDDFRLFLDGQLQQIKSVEKGRGPRRVHDNRDWHIEASDRPPGRWSSADLEDPPHSLWEGATFYLVDYAPPSATSGQGCHKIRVEVRNPDIRAIPQDDYCQGQTLLDSQYGTKIGSTLQGELARGGAGKIPLSVQTGTFRTASGRPLTDVVIGFPGSQLRQKRDRDNKLYATIGVLGAIYTRDGKLVTRFSDLLWWRGQGAAAAFAHAHCAEIRLWSLTRQYR